MIHVNPDVLRWARETAGLSLDQAAQKIDLKEARGVSGERRLAQLESGASAPTRSQLARMAKQYRRPLIAFYLSAPPSAGDRGQDFRTLPAAQKTTSAPLVDALLRDIKARQEMVRAVLIDAEEATPLAFIGSARMADGVPAVVAAIRRTLGIDTPELRATANPDESFALLRARAESIGVFVLLAGNLGSHHTSLDVEVFRGFALADSIAPFIVINDLDARSAWSFTLLHELAHLWLGETGVSGLYGQSKLEQFCSDVASTFVLPDHELATLAIDQPGTGGIASAIGVFARERHLSRSMVAYRLLRSGRLDENAWQTLSVRFREEWRQSREARRARERDSEGGPNYYVVRRHRLGSALLRLVSRSMNEGLLVPTKAARILGVKPRSVEPLLRGASLSAAGGA
ncbi:MAG TPA: XRE family transcriptional regulator [Candidatus Acidoferrum sp.]|nr:XRE family transcriptional regulator [Candidatus Acidoferrum sp.]